MNSKVILAIFMVISHVTAAAKDSEDVKKMTDSRTVYDQRQTGKYNVHVNIKDVHFFNIKDAISSLGDYGSYDYGDYESVEGSEDYDAAHLTVSPIFAFLGARPSKPPTTSTTTTTTTTEKSEATSDSLVSSNNGDNKEETTAKQELETTVKQESVSTNFSTSSTTTAKPASKIKVNESIDYEEIPVEVQYYRTNQSKLPLGHAPSSSLIKQNNNRHAVLLKRHRRPSVVQILDGRTNNNVKVVESDDQERTVKICGQGEFRDNHGRCRLRANGRNRAHGLRRILNILSSILPKSK